MSEKAIVLSSGGVDSTTCVGLAVRDHGAENVTTVSVRYGQKHDKELKCAEDVAKYYNVRHEVIDLTAIFKDAKSCSLIAGSDEEVPEGAYADQIENSGKVSTYVPFRNGLMLSAVASLAGSLYPDDDVIIYLGAHADDAAGDAYADCRPDFAEHMAAAINIGTYGKIRCHYPLINENKSGVVRIGLELGVPYELTWSCYVGGDNPCGKCGTCIDRQKAFEENGVADPALKEDK